MALDRGVPPQGADLQPWPLVVLAPDPASRRLAAAPPEGDRAGKTLGPWMVGWS